MQFIPIYKTILLKVIILCMCINLILLTIYAFNGRNLNKACKDLYLSS